MATKTIELSTNSLSIAGMDMKKKRSTRRRKAPSIQRIMRESARDDVASVTGSEVASVMGSEVASVTGSEVASVMGSVTGSVMGEYENSVKDLEQLNKQPPIFSPPPATSIAVPNETATLPVTLATSFATTPSTSFATTLATSNQPSLPAPPYGNLKGGSKPTYREWKHTQRQSHPQQSVKRTIRRYNVGKEGNKVGILLKNVEIKEKVESAHNHLKQHSLEEVKKYLIEHNLIKSNCTAPENVLREMYENSYLSGNVMNDNPVTIIYNLST